MLNSNLFQKISTPVDGFLKNLIEEDVKDFSSVQYARETLGERIGWKVIQWTASGASVFGAVCYFNYVIFGHASFLTVSSVVGILILAFLEFKKGNGLSKLIKYSLQGNHLDSKGNFSFHSFKKYFLSNLITSIALVAFSFWSSLNGVEYFYKQQKEEIAAVLDKPIRLGTSQKDSLDLYFEAEEKRIEARYAPLISEQKSRLNTIQAETKGQWDKSSRATAGLIPVIQDRILELEKAQQRALDQLEVEKKSKAAYLEALEKQQKNKEVEKKTALKEVQNDNFYIFSLLCECLILMSIWRIAVIRNYTAEEQKNTQPNLQNYVNKPITIDLHTQTNPLVESIKIMIEAVQQSNQAANDNMRLFLASQGNQSSPTYQSVSMRPQTSTNGPTAQQLNEVKNQLETMLAELQANPQADAQRINELKAKLKGFEVFIPPSSNPHNKRLF